MASNNHSWLYNINNRGRVEILLQQRLFDHDAVEPAGNGAPERLEYRVEDGAVVDVHHGEHGALDAEHGAVEVGAVQEEVELDVVVREAEDVALLDLLRHPVLLPAPRPDRAPGVEHPAVGVQAEALVQVRACCAHAAGPVQFSSVIFVFKTRKDYFFRQKVSDKLSISMNIVLVQCG